MTYLRGAPELHNLLGSLALKLVQIYALRVCDVFAPNLSKQYDFRQEWWLIIHFGIGKSRTRDLAVFGKMDAETAETNVLCPHCKSDLGELMSIHSEKLHIASDTSDSLKRRNKRLTDKLEQNKGYTEELRAQVQKLTKEIADLKLAKSRSVSTASQFEELDAKKAESLSKYGYAIDDGDAVGDEQDSARSKWGPDNSASIADQAREAAEEATRTQGRDYTNCSSVYALASDLHIRIMHLLYV